jgi:membrane protein
MNKKNTRKPNSHKNLFQKNPCRFFYLICRYTKLCYRIFRVSIADTIRQDGVEHAGYLAFLSILSLFPFLLFLVSIIGHFGGSAVGSKFISMAIDSLPQQVAQTLTPRINEILSGPPQTLLTIAIIGVIWTASSSVEGCRTILNRAYRVEFPPPYIFRRFISILEFFAITVSISFGILVFVIAPITLKFIESRFNITFYFNYDWLGLRYMAIYLLLFCAVTLFYYALPNAKQHITQTIPGSILTVTLWVWVEKLFSYYLANFHQFSFIYGSLAGVIISLMFFYLINLIFIFGAEFNYHFHRVFKILLK